MVASPGGLPSAPDPGPPPADPFPRRTAYAPGALSPGRRSGEDLDRDVAAYYERWKAAYIRPAGVNAAGEPLYRVVWNPGQEDESVSEGQGYGLVIVASLAGHDPAARQLFDGIVRFVRRHPSAQDHRLTQWHEPLTDRTHAYAAFDGDADIAYGLLLANRQWGSDGPIDYRAEALRTIGGLATILGPTSGLPLPGDAVLLDGLHLDEEYTVRVSDLMPAHFQAFGRATGDPRWADAASRSQQVVAALQAHWSPDAGLVPDFAVPPADGSPTLDDLGPAGPGTVEGLPTDGSYAYNSARIPWRFGLDALLSGDPTSRAIAGRFVTWAEAATDGDPTRLVNGYRLDGSPLGTTLSTAFVAPLGVAAMTQPGHQPFLDAVYAVIRTTHQDYYNDSLSLLCLLALSGNVLTA